MLIVMTSIAISAQETGDRCSGRQEEQEVIKVQNSLIDAYLHNDYAVLDRVLADDYAYTMMASS
jgi:hypothetical protein